MDGKKLTEIFAQEMRLNPNAIEPEKLQRVTMEETAFHLWRDLHFGNPHQIERAQQLLKNAPDEVRAEVMRRASGSEFKQPRKKPPTFTARKIRY